jgi:hypothetical protein
MGLQGMINDMVQRCDFDLSAPRAAGTEGAGSRRPRRAPAALAQIITALENGAVAGEG